MRIPTRPIVRWTKRCNVWRRERSMQCFARNCEFVEIAIYSKAYTGCYEQCLIYHSRVISSFPNTAKQNGGKYCEIWLAANVIWPNAIRLRLWRIDEESFWNGRFVVRFRHHRCRNATETFQWTDETCNRIAWEPVGTLCRAHRPLCTHCIRHFHGSFVPMAHWSSEMIASNEQKSFLAIVSSVLHLTITIQ